MTILAQWGLPEITALGTGLAGGGVVAAWGLYRFTSLFHNGKAAADPPPHVCEDRETRIRTDGLEARADAAEAARSTLFEKIDEVGVKVAATREKLDLVHAQQTVNTEKLGDVAVGVAKIAGMLERTDLP